MLASPAPGALINFYSNSCILILQDPIKRVHTKKSLRWNFKVKARQHSASRGGSYAKYGEELGRRSTNGHGEEGRRRKGQLVREEGEEGEGAYPDLEP